MRFIPLFFLFFAVILLTTSCSRTNDRLLQAEQLIETAPDSAMTILQKYNYNSLTDTDKALYGLLYVQIRDKKLLPLEPDSLLDFSLKYYNGKQTDYERLAACYLYKGRKLKYVFQYEMSMEYYMKAILLNINNNTLLAKIYSDLGQIYNQQSDYSAAREKYKRAYSYYKEAKSEKSAFYSLLDIGRTYTFQHLIDSAQIFYKMVLNQANDSIVLGDVYQEIGIAYYYFNKYDSALFYLKKSINFPFIKNSKAIRYYYTADVFFDINYTDSANYFAKKAFDFGPDIRTQRECYRILTNCASIYKNSSNVKLYMSLYQDCNDSIRKIDSQTKGSYIETMLNTQKEAEKSRSWIWYLLISILLLIAGSIYLYIHKHKRTELKIKLNEENHFQQKAEIRKDIMLKMRTSLLANIERIKTEHKLSEKGTVNFHARVKSMYDELLHIQDTTLFFYEMDGALNSIVTKLKSKSPDIKEKELIWCCLHLLDVPTHDILILLDYETINSLKRLKGRLAIKLGLENAALLSDYLLQLLTID